MALNVQYEFLFAGRDEGSFLENYAYEVNEHRSGMGQVFVCLEIQNNPSEAEAMGEAIFSALKTTFFAETEGEAMAEGYLRFENSLKAINRRISDFRKGKLQKHIGSVHAIVAAIENGSLYLSQAGDSEAYLIRKRFVSTVSEGLYDPSQKDGDLFTSIANGDLEPGDFVLMCTTRLLRYVTKTDLSRMVLPSSAQRTLSDLRDHLSGEILGRIGFIGAGMSLITDQNPRHEIDDSREGSDEVFRDFGGGEKLNVLASFGPVIAKAKKYHQIIMDRARASKLFEKTGPVGRAAVENNTNTDMVIPNDCPGEPLDVYSYIDGAWKQITANPDIQCNPEKTMTIKANSKLKVSYDSWNHALFGTNGRYKIALKTADGKQIESPEFTEVDQNMFKWFWTKVFYQPIYNVLIFLTVKLPYHDLGFAIILLTILIRLILLVPSQNALKSQKKMQMLQPKLEEIKEKHKGDQQKISLETMELWKTHKVNPFGSCLPLLLQFPVFIALFYVVRTGLNPDDAHLLYSGFVAVPFSQIHTLFLGVLELTKPNAFVLPFIVGILQFIQMKMTMKRAGGDKGGKKSDMEMANGMMVYVLPVMVAFITISVPAAAGLYWATSTLFGIAQQYVVNKGSETGHSGGKKDSPKQIITVKA
jgi:YidC/Oxa1 family membrane protein insertase